MIYGDNDNEKSKSKNRIVQRAAFTILATAALITVATTKGALIVPDHIQRRMDGG